MPKPTDSMVKTEKARKSCVFIGLGHMGLPMALNLLRGAIQVTAFDLNPDRVRLAVAEGAQPLSEEAISAADAILLSLPAPPIVEKVLDPQEGPLGEIHDKIVLDLSTEDPVTAQRLEQSLSERRLRYVHGPVIGGETGSRKGILTILLGGTAADVKAVAPYVRLLGRRTPHVGAPPQAAALKLANVMLGQAMSVGFAEALAFAVAWGVPGEVVHSSLKDGIGLPWLLEQRWHENIVPGRYEPGGTVALVLKDLRLVMAGAQTHGIPLNVISAALATYSELPPDHLQRSSSVIAERFEQIIGRPFVESRPALAHASAT